MLLALVRGNNNEREIEINIATLILIMLATFGLSLAMIYFGSFLQAMAYAKGLHKGGGIPVKIIK